MSEHHEVTYMFSYRIISVSKKNDLFLQYSDDKRNFLLYFVPHREVRNKQNLSAVLPKTVKAQERIRNRTIEVFLHKHFNHKTKEKFDFSHRKRKKFQKRMD